MNTSKRNNNMILLAAFSLMMASCSKTDGDTVVPAPGQQQSTERTSQTPQSAEGQWTVISNEVFTISAPEGWVNQRLPSLDTYFGTLRKGNDSINYEYSINPDSFQLDPDRFSIHYETVDGKRAKIIEGDRLGIAFDRVGNDPATPHRLLLMQASSNPLDQETVLRMFRSIRFK